MYKPLLALLLILAFGIFLFWVKWMAVLLLCLAFGILIHSLWRLPHEDILDWFALRPIQHNAKIWLLLAVVVSVLLSVCYRSFLGEAPALTTLRLFSLTAISIGATEELVFRGYFYGVYRSRATWVAISFSALAHTAYKTAIFLPFPSVTLWNLSLLTFLAGLFLGWMRSASGSLWPCLFFHAVFDLWVYGDQLTPWWVW